MALYRSEQNHMIRALNAISGVGFSERDVAGLFTAFRREAARRKLVATRDLGDFIAHPVRDRGEVYERVLCLRRVLRLMVQSIDGGSGDIPKIVPVDFKKCLQKLVELIPKAVVQGVIGISREDVQQEIENIRLQQVNKDKWQVVYSNEHQTNFMRSVILLRAGTAFYSQDQITDELRSLVSIEKSVRHDIEERIMLGVIALLHGKVFVLEGDEVPLVAWADDEKTSVTRKISIGCQMTLKNTPAWKPLYAIMKIIQTDLPDDKLDKSILMQYRENDVLTKNVDPNAQITVTTIPMPRLVVADD